MSTTTTNTTTSGQPTVQDDAGVPHIRCAFIASDGHMAAFCFACEAPWPCPTARRAQENCDGI